MKRCAFPVIFFVGLSLLSLASSAQLETLPGLILTDLQLISQESLPHWTPAWTGPIQAATLAAWFADHGYPALMRDFNADDVIDELDTIHLADIFGRGIMQTQTPRGTTDVRLVIGLGSYVAEHYPDEFVLKIYDLGFPAEYAAQGYGTFATDVIPGIVLDVIEEPSIAAYIRELRDGEGVIAGLENAEVDRNLYLSGRSFLYERTPAGYTPLDFAWSKEDAWKTGHQGQVLETVGKMEDRFYVEFLGSWKPVEFMLALSPVVEHDVPSDTHACADNAIAYHVTTTTTPHGAIEVEECVVREGDFDIYIWTVTNISFLSGGCGLCLFAIPNPGLATANHGESAPWIFTSAWGAWIWWLPGGSCGLLPGQSAVFSVTVPGPTTDVWVIAGVGACAPTPGMIAPTFLGVDTTGPGGPDDTPNGRCPDLVIRVVDESCVYDPTGDVYRVTVWANVLNIGSVAVDEPFDVMLTGTSHPGSDTITVPVPPVIPPGGSVPVSLSFDVPVPPTGAPPCPLNYEVMVDSSYQIDECIESNNLVYGDICCRGEPETGETCPDLTVDIREIGCEFDRKNGIYELTLTARITNIGTETVTDPIWVEATCDQGWDMDVIHTDLAPGVWADVSFSITFSVNLGECPIPVTVEVDYVRFITECDEDNNTDTADACCRY